MKEKIKNEINLLKQNEDKKLNLGILFATIILFIYCYFGSFSFFEQHFSHIDNINYWKIIYHNLMAFLLFFVIGVIYTKFIMKQKLLNFGIGVGKAKLGLKIGLIATPIAILCGLTTIADGQMVATYPLVDFAVYGEWYYILIYFLSYFLYYLGWEYLFRGLILNSCKEKCGVVASLLITTLISALIHTSISAFGKPMIETLSAIPAGLIFGYITFKTNSIYCGLFLHMLVGFSTDILIFLIV